MSIYETIGGEALVADAVEKFYTRLRDDPLLVEFFARADAGGLETHQRMFLTAALGGPDAYEGRDMRAAHAHLPITDVDFERFIGHLRDTLVELGVASEKIDEVIDALAPLQVEIVSAAQDAPDEFGSVDPIGGSG